MAPLCAAPLQRRRHLMALAVSEGGDFAPSTAWREIIQPGEHELFERFAREIVAYQKEDARSTKDGKPLRGFHAKIHAGLIGEFRVLGNLPDHARQGAFRTAKVFP